MEKIDDLRLMEMYISKYNINEIFTNDMKQFMELMIFKKNEHICKDGEVIEYLFFFVKGKAKVYTTLGNGKSLLLCFYKEFKVLGDLEIIECETASTNVQVIEETLCIGISKENVNKYLLKDSKFLTFICSSLSSKLNRCSKNSSINLLYPLKNRLASYILATAEKKDNDSKENIVLNDNLTEISELLGTSYRHLLRTINTLCINEIIRKKDNYYEIIDEMNLRKLASDLYMD